MRVSCPRIMNPCFYGSDFPTRKELIACTHMFDQIREFLGVDSLGFISIEGLLGAVRGETRSHYCTACFTGKYPLPFGKEADKYILERKFAGESRPPEVPASKVGDVSRRDIEAG